MMPFNTSRYWSKDPMFMYAARGKIQHGSLKNYIELFERDRSLLYLPEKERTGIFLGGLKTEIASILELFKPTTLAEAINLAQLQEKNGSFGEIFQSLEELKEKVKVSTQAYSEADKIVQRQRSITLDFETMLSEEKKLRKEDQEKANDDLSLALQKAYLEAQETVRHQNEVYLEQLSIKQEVINQLQDTEEKNRELLEILGSKLDSALGSLEMAEEKIRQLEVQIEYHLASGVSEINSSLPTDIIVVVEEDLVKDGSIYAMDEFLDKNSVKSNKRNGDVFKEDFKDYPCPLNEDLNEYLTGNISDNVVAGRPVHEENTSSTSMCEPKELSCVKDEVFLNGKSEDVEVVGVSPINPLASLHSIKNFRDGQVAHDKTTGSNSEVNDIKDQAITICLVHRDQMLEIFNQYPWLINSEEIIIFAYERTTTDEIENKLFQKGLKAHDYQCDEWKELSGEVEIITRLMHINVYIFVRSSFFLLQGPELCLLLGSDLEHLKLKKLLNASKHALALPEDNDFAMVIEKFRFRLCHLLWLNAQDIREQIQDKAYVFGFNPSKIKLREEFGYLEISKQLCQGISEVLKKLTIFIWGWYYKDIGVLFDGFVEDFEVKSNQSSQFVEHPGCRIMQWMIAWL